MVQAVKILQMKKHLIPIFLLTSTSIVTG